MAASSSSSSSSLSSTSNPVQINPIYFLSNISNLVPFKLEKSNYNLWKYQISAIFRTHSLFGFLDGSKPCPPQFLLDNNGNESVDLNPEFQTWILQDQAMIVLINATLTENSLSIVVGKTTSREVWLALETQFDSSQKSLPNADGKTTFEEAEDSITAKDKKRDVILYKAAVTGHWETAKKIFEEDEDSITAKITADSETVLHTAVGTGKTIHFVEKLVEMMQSQALALQNKVGNTALHFAAQVGNKEAAIILVKKNQSLLYIQDHDGWYPGHRAAIHAHKDTLLYLLSVTEDNVDPGPLSNQSGAQLLINIIISGFLDVALDLAQRYPHLTTVKTVNGNSPLLAIARNASAFPSGSSLNFWQCFIYSCVPVNLENYANNPNGSDVENPAASSQVYMNTQSDLNFQKLQLMFWNVGELLVPWIKHFREKKLLHHQALQLVKFICNEIKSTKDGLIDGSLYITPTVEAARLGIHEVVEEIVDAFPDAVLSHLRQDNRFIFHIAIVNRCENVFNLIYQMSAHKQRITNLLDISENTILHLAGNLAPPHKLKLVSGAALQMQRELQWFKEVEKFLNPAFRELKNSDGKTAATIFSEQHKGLVIEGEKWMKDTATSCTIAAALIATIVFAAAITVPGGNHQDSGLPIFSREIAFIIFAISDAISLFFSTTSLLMFLSILTARYGEADFLYVLPKRLIIGLLTLFLSITSMMVTFSATLYLMFFKNNAWVTIPIASLACLPVTLFVSLQFPLLVGLISSTYSPGIFGKKSDRPFY